MPKVVYMEIDEDLPALLDRLRRVREKEFYLAVPAKSLLFRSLVNLELLRAHLKEDGRKAVLVTADAAGRYLAEKAGFRVEETVEVKAVPLPEESEPNLRLRPIQARRNEVARETPRRIHEKKITIRELIGQLRHSKQKKGSEDWQAPPPRSYRRTVAWIGLLSVGLFALVGYLAIPGATLYIKPTFETLNHTVNVVLAESRRNQKILSENRPHVLAYEIVSVTASQTKTFATAGKEFYGTNARGRIRVVNESTEPWSFKKGTRFQTEDGIIFRSLSGFQLQKPLIGENGEVKPSMLILTVEADPVDIYGRPVGERGNIPPGRFTLPGLSRLQQKWVWGESAEPMVGGTTDYQLRVSRDDVESAKRQIEDRLLVLAREELKNRLEEMNRLGGAHRVLLEDTRTLKTEIVEMRLPEDLEGSFRDKFEIFARIRAEGVAYDRWELFDLMKKEIQGRVRPDMILKGDSLKPENMTLDVIEIDPDAATVKASVALRGIQEYALEAGSDPVLDPFSTRLKKLAAGLPVEEAKNVIGNLPEVANVQIRLWPFWLKKLPHLPENIAVRPLEEP